MGPPARPRFELRERHVESRFRWSPWSILRPMSVKNHKPAPGVRAPRANATAGATYALGRSLPVALIRASHPRQALLVTATLTVGAALAGRTTRDVCLVLATVLVGQILLGWHNDFVDADRDTVHARESKPVAVGYLEKSTLGFSILVAILLVIPLSIAHGTVSGLTWLGILAIAMLANAGLMRRSQFSYLPWMASFGLIPAFLSYGGWGGEGAGGPPTLALTVAAALLGIGVHTLVSLPGLVDDDKEGSRSFPLRIALRIGAPRLLMIATVYTVTVSAAILISALTAGLVQ